MSFTLKKITSFSTKVEVALPNEAGGQDKGDFTCTFKHLDRAAFRDLVDAELPDPEFIDAVLLDVKGLGDESGPLDKATAIETVKNHLGLSGAVIRAYFDAAGSAGAKNSKPSRRT